MSNLAVSPVIGPEGLRLFLAGRETQAINLCFIINIILRQPLTLLLVNRSGQHQSMSARIRRVTLSSLMTKVEDKKGRDEYKRPLDIYPFGALGVSYIAQQAYCEQMIDLWLKNPSGLISIPAGMEARIEEVPEAKRQLQMADQGTEFHDSVSSSGSPASWEEIKELLRSGRSLTLLESGLQGDYHGLPIVGRPDAICFDGWKASYVLEYKVTEYDRLYLSHRVQLLLYGYLLEQESFNVNDLTLVCVFVPRRNRGWLGSLTETQAENFLSVVRSEAESLLQEPASSDYDWYRAGIRVTRGVEVKLRAIKYNRREALRHLEVFGGYWLGNRQPRPTTTKRKCEICLYNAAGLCSVASAPYMPIKKSK